MQGLDGSTIPSAHTTMSIPISPGDVLSAKARAVTPLGYRCGNPPVPCPYSDWTTLVKTNPPSPSGFSATLKESIMAAPTFVAEYPTVFNTVTTPKTVMSAIAINNGDVLIDVSSKESEIDSPLGITENGTSSWITIQADATANYAAIASWSYIATTGESLTVTSTKNASGAPWHGSNVLRFSGSSGIGASAKSKGTTGSPAVTLTTTQDNSAIVMICGDFAAVAGTQTLSSTGGAGSGTLKTGFPGNSNNYGVAIGVYLNAGTAGSKTVGMTAPTGQKWNILAVEVKGVSGGATNVGNVMDSKTLRGLTLGRSVR
jgi:hypothetical protein